MGNKVRYDGGHTWNPFIADTLGQYMDFVPVCPEVECGLGTPRPSMHLKGAVSKPRLVVTDNDVDYTDQMTTWAGKKLEELVLEGLCGYIFKNNSPSCGMARVNVFNAKGRSVKKGSGIFAGMFMKRFPLIPVEEEGRLNDPELRENFIERIFIFMSEQKEPK